MTNTLQKTINFIRPFCRYQEANIGTDGEPILSIATIVRNIMLAAPFTWSWNRANVNLTGPVQQGTQDYEQEIDDFGFIEKASADDGNRIWEIEDVKNNEGLAQTDTEARPGSIAVQEDDGDGTITFRLSAVPNANYTINVVYQKEPVPFTATTSSWAPVPDSMSDVYNNMVLGYYMDSCQDPRGPQYISRGIAGLLARAVGLSDTDKAIFASSYMSYEAAQMMNSLRTQQGSQAQAAR